MYVCVCKGRTILLLGGAGWNIYTVQEPFPACDKQGRYFSSQKAVHNVQFIQHDFFLLMDAAGIFQIAPPPPPPEGQMVRL